ncbi:MAG: hypothetical protein ABF479_13645 [Gluconacetobacter sp.]
MESGRIRGILSKWRRMTWTLFVAADFLVTRYHPFGYLFGFRDFEAAHGYFVETMILFGLWSAGIGLYYVTFGRGRWRADMRDRRERLRNRTAQPISFSARMAFLLVSLVVLVVSLYKYQHDSQPHPGGLIVPLLFFGLFVLVEISRVMVPSDSMVFNPDDEWVVFLRARTLRIGYGTAIFVLCALGGILLYAPSLALVACPVGLAMALAVPACAYQVLDRRAAALQ